MCLYIYLKGVPDMKDGVWSLPVEICWEEEKCHHLAGLLVQQKVFLSQQTLHTIRVQGKALWTPLMA